MQNTCIYTDRHVCTQTGKIRPKSRRVTPSGQETNETIYQEGGAVEALVTTTITEGQKKNKQNNLENRTRTRTTICSPHKARKRKRERVSQQVITFNVLEEQQFKQKENKRIETSLTSSSILQTEVMSTT